MRRSPTTIGPHVSEHEEQAAFFSYVLQAYRWREDFKRSLFFAVPNAAKRSVRLAARMKAEGMTAGVSDILYLQPRGPYCYLAIEMKTPDRRNEKRGGLSTDQEGFLADAAGEGACVDVCYGADEAIAVFTRYMSLEVINEKENEQGTTSLPGGTEILAGAGSDVLCEPAQND